MSGASERERELEREIERLRAELDESRATVLAMFDRNPAMKMLVDVESGDIVDASSAAITYYGYSLDELKGMRIEEINCMPAELLKREREHAKTDERNHFEFRHRLASGEIRDVEVYTSVVRREERELIFSIIHDITERNRLAEQLLQVQKMEALGMLAGGVAHDFNNLLTALLCLSELVSARTPDESPVRGYVREIRNVADRGASLTRQLLAFSRKQVLHPELLDLNNIVSEVERLLRRVIGQKVHLDIQLADQLGPVIADPGQIEQVVVNLVLNARDAMPDGGTVSVSTAEVTLGGAAARRMSLERGTYIEVCVSDQGIGMNAETVARAFEPFFTTKQRGHGTGLGLSTVYGIIKQSGGAVTVESEPGRGSRFRVLLPRVEERTQAPSSPVESPKDVRLFGSETVLLVDDEEAIRSVAREILEQRGYRVLETFDGQAALEICEAYEGRIDIIVTDVVMPRVDGRELARIAGERWPSIRVLYMSGYIDAPVVEHGMLDAAANILAKPFTPETLLEKVRLVLDTGGRSRMRSMRPDEAKVPASNA